MTLKYFLVSMNIYPFLSLTCLCFDLALVVGVNSRQVSIATKSMVKPQPYNPSQQRPQKVEKLFLPLSHNTMWTRTNVFQLLSVVLAQF